MRTRDALNAAEALVLTMVLVAAADGAMTDREIGVMSGQVQTLPAFQDFTTARLIQVTDAAVRLLGEDDGLEHAARLLRSALSTRLRETAYALGCEVVAADGAP
jgi:tellurite resistance protein